MEALVAALREAYRIRRVLVTGHTGFKGAWLCEWLLLLGAKVAGFSLEPPTTPALFDQLGLATRLRHQIGDVRDSELLRESVAEFAPELVFHLAAQSLVRASYAIPVETFATNVLGTAHLLEAIRILDRPCAVIIVTTDKCYENKGSGRAFRENDRLGGHDPYSASKAAAELVVEAYRKSFFADAGSKVAVASARAGNVIGGGDWAVDRIVPDAIRALARGESIPARHPRAVRPFQHVLDPLAGYLLLGKAVLEDRSKCTAFNFGPERESHRTVESLVNEILLHWPGSWRDASEPGAVHEAKFLHLAIKKARTLLGWNPVWDFSEAVRQTVEWYRQAAESSSQSDVDCANLAAFTQRQILTYMEAAEQIAH